MTDSKEVCGRCGKVHTGPPFDMDAQVNRLAQEMADLIDAEILEELLAEFDAN